MGVIENRRVINHKSIGNMKRKRKIQLYVRCTIGAILLVAAIVGIYLLAFLGYTRVNLHDLTTVQLSGYNGKGQVSYVVDQPETLKDFLHTVSVTFDKSEELSNGDKINVTYYYDKALAKKLKLRVKSSTEHVTVDGLPEARIITNEELFKDIDIRCSGVVPIAKVELVNNSTEDIISGINFSIVDEKEFYDLGDVVRVEAQIEPENYVNQAIVFQGGSDGYVKDFTVETVDQFITDASEVSPELLQQMKEHAVTLFGHNSGDANEYGLRVFSSVGKMYSTENGQYTFRWGSPSYISSYFATITDDYTGEVGTHVNDVKLVFEGYIIQSNESSVYAEAVVMYRNLVKHFDGSVDVDLSSGQIISVSTKDSEIKEIVRCTADNQYDAVKIDPVE